ncbi:MAG: chemotaxis protein [Desulfobacteraceae bacterium IS3]|nr:MAG: chemotaxis protein [Desulfobacteraceae bacterium IS3]
MGKHIQWGLILSLTLGIMVCHAAQEKLEGFDLQVKQWAEECRQEVSGHFEQLLQSGKLTEAQAFDTFYIPIPNTSPQKYHTQYDRITDQAIQAILDKCLAKNDKIVFVVAVDTNGYLPTHNKKYSQQPVGNAEADLNNSRQKRIFNDRTGLSAAKNTDPFLLQRYSRDTGEMMADLSVPIMIRGKHWGALRVGYKITK